MLCLLGLLKEYLRELPEPVFSSCLYQMLVDALGVFLPNDPDGNAKLVFSILDCLPKANRVRNQILCVVYFLFCEVRCCCHSSLKYFVEAELSLSRGTLFILIKTEEQEFVLINLVLKHL